MANREERTEAKVRQGIGRMDERYKRTGDVVE
jgi:hypothetical protein